MAHQLARKKIKGSPPGKGVRRSSDAQDNCMVVWSLSKFYSSPCSAHLCDLVISVRHEDAGDAVASPTLKNWPLFGQKI